MQPVPLTEAAGALLRKIGAGRRQQHNAGACVLAYQPAGGEGLILHAQIAGAPVRLWLDARQWCRWLEPMLVVPTWSAVPVELREALAAWTCASADPGCINDDWLVGGTIETGYIEPAQDWCLRLEQQERQLTLRVLDAPLAWLDTLADQFEPIPPDPKLDSPAPRVPVSLVVGWSTLDAHALQQLNVGDAILLQHAYRPAKGELCLFMNRPLAVLTQDETGNFTIGNLMDHSNDWLDITPASLTENGSNLMVRVVAEAASLQAPLAALAHLSVGDVLEGPAHSDGLVTLTVGGRPVARGLLLDINGRLAVRIEHLA
ncbi:MAG: type III secretion protein Q [Glomeribacter sp. 1016415]|nr:type III secretion protein Q [Glomeribacter sp. 1016415]